MEPISRHLLQMPRGERKTPPKGKAQFKSISSYSRDRQKSRLGKKFDDIGRLLTDPDSSLLLARDPTRVAPERVIVLEVVESVDNFIGIASRIEGLEFLADEGVLIESPDEFDDSTERESHGEGEKGDRRDLPDDSLLDEGDEPESRAVGGRMYLSMPNQAALAKIVSLWQSWQGGEELPYGLKSVAQLFMQLSDIRAWGPKERISDLAIAHWEKSIEGSSDEFERIEVELWFHEIDVDANAHEVEVRQQIEGAGGEVVHQSRIEQIGYHALLVDLPASVIRKMVERSSDSDLVMNDRVRYYQPQSAFGVPPVEVEEFDAKAIFDRIDRSRVDSTLPAISAIIDGYPADNNPFLQGRLEVVDYNRIESQCVVEGRIHGTGIVSLILHGDLNAYRNTLSRKLMVYPVLVTVPQLRVPFVEQVAENKLFVDTLYRTIIEIVQTRDSEAGTRSEVFIINLSIGNDRQPLQRSISPLVRVLDRLAFEHDLLILVSAGNMPNDQPIYFKKSGTPEKLMSASQGVQERELLRSIHRARSERTILSPAEAVNVVTVGAQSVDSTGVDYSSQWISYGTKELPNVLSRMGPGYNDSVKPEVLLPGGQVYMRPNSLDDSDRSIHPLLLNRAGLRVAGPETLTDSLGTHTSVGTSGATALATRAAHLCYEALIIEDDNGERVISVPPSHNAVVVKAMVVHSAEWGKGGEVLGHALGPKDGRKHAQRRSNIARFLGYGVPNVERVLICSANQATLVGHGSITAGQICEHSIPLPESLHMSNAPRSITVTVAWLSPVNARHHEYRTAKLQVTNRAPDMKTALGVKRTPNQPAGSAADRGTVFHAKYFGKQAISFIDNDYLRLDVHCKAAAGKLDSDIKYGILVTIQTAANIPIYNEVKEALALTVEEHAERITVAASKRNLV